MDSMVVLIIMFFLGFAQLIWAVFHASMTSIPQVKKHFINYFVGVVIYFIAVIGFGAITIESQILFTGFLLLFFGGAFGLAGYHFFIVSMSLWLGWPRNVKKPSNRWAFHFGIGSRAKSAKISQINCFLMDFVIVDVLFIMMVLGFVQLVVAGIQVQASRYVLIRTQFEYYFIGVAFYTVIGFSSFLGTIAWEPFTVVAKIHFFGGAGLLATYHFVILAIGFRMRYLSKRMSGKNGQIESLLP